MRVACAKEQTEKGRPCRQPAAVGSHFCPYHQPGGSAAVSQYEHRLREMSESGALERMHRDIHGKQEGGE